MANETKKKTTVTKKKPAAKKGADRKKAKPAENGQGAGNAPAADELAGLKPDELKADRRTEGRTGQETSCPSRGEETDSDVF